MKPMIIAFILFLMVQFCQATKDTILLEEPWRAIVFMDKYNPGIRWEKDISIKLFGSYTSSDSLMIENSIRVLNDLTETVKLRITNHERGNLEIFFLDSINEKVFESIMGTGKNMSSVTNYNHNYGKLNEVFMPVSIRHYELGIRLSAVPKDSCQIFLTKCLAKALCPINLSIEYRFKKGKEVKVRPVSIFEQKTFDKKTETWTIIHPYSELSNFDRNIIKAVYSSDFPSLLPIAKKQFLPVPSWIRVNIRKILVFPYLLVMLLFTGLFIIFYKKTGRRIKNRFFLFNVISILALLTIGFITSIFYFATVLIGDPYFGFFQRKDVLFSFIVFFVLGLLGLNLIWLIELAIHRRAHHKYFKVLLLFLSTSLIPSATVFSITYFAAGKKILPPVLEFLFTLFSVFTFIGVIRALISFFILKEKEIKIENEVKLANLRELKSKAELNALHSKINPHFLYNALNSIAGLAKADAEKTEQMALSLSKLFRYSINKEQTDWSNFAEEMEMVRIYLDIEKVRFDDRLEFFIELPDELKSYKIPRFIIQPLVENAVKHGVSKLVTKGKITVSVRRNDKWIEIAVADNGPDFAHELAPGFGLQSIYDKLEIMYPDRFEMHFINAPDKHILIKLG